MSWDAIAALAELAGALAVIATLVYLTVQLRQNSALLKASIATASRESTNQLTGLLASDREALRVFYAGLESRTDLEKLDRQHFDAMMSLYLEALLQSYQQQFDEALERAHWMLRQPGFKEFWHEFKDLYGSGFVSHIEGMMARSK